jgi:ABC-type transport system involved in cytochrome c biogenesis permease subunit
MNEPKVIMSLMFFTMAFGFYLITACLYMCYWVLKKNWVGQAATAMTYIALLSSTMFLVMRAVESGHAPFSNLYESMVLFVWAMTAGYLFMEHRYKMKVMGAFVMTLAVFAMLAASMLPFRFKSVEPLNPALQNKWHWLINALTPLGLENYAIGWLDFHVFTTFISYAAFAIAFGLSVMYLIRRRFELRQQGNFLVERLPDSDTLDELSYHTIAWGFPFLAVGIISGAMWANYAWGTYWSWDPKETWSLITWFIYAAYLHARITRGWRGKRSAYLSIIGFTAVVFLYWGVSFVLPGLHAYA